MNTKVDGRILFTFLLAIGFVITACGTLEVGLESDSSQTDPLTTATQPAGAADVATATVAMPEATQEPTLEPTLEATPEPAAEQIEPPADEVNQDEPFPIAAAPGEMTNLDEVWFEDSNYATPSEITMLDETWFLYSNYQLGFSIKFPRTKTHHRGSCVWIEEDGDHSYRPRYALVPVKIFEEENTVYMTSEYQHELSGETRETNADGGTRIFFSECEAVMNSLELLHDSEYYQEMWEIVVRDIHDDQELDTFLESRYGSGCGLGEKVMSGQDGVYDIRVGCPLGGGTVVKYHPEGNKVIAWNTGQAYTFSADVTNSVNRDQEMVDSFRFLTGESTDTSHDTSQDSADYDYTGWQTYSNDELGYSLMYPGSAEVMGGNLDEAVEFVGPIGEVDHWPWFLIHHFDSEFFNPPSGTDVQQWIADSNIPYEPVDQDVTIGGLPAVRFSFGGSPMAYASDEYYIIYGDQLLRITILHTELAQDWYLYDQFLNSIAFAPV